MTTEYSIWVIAVFSAIILAVLVFSSKPIFTFGVASSRRGARPSHRLLALLLVPIFAWSIEPSIMVIAAEGDSPLAGDALRPPPHPPTIASFGDVTPSLYQPSAFLAGRVAVQAIFVESDGSKEPSTKNWTDAQVADIHSQLADALEWWRAGLPNARLSFDLTSQIVPTGYEPINHGLGTEGLWAGDALRRMGFSGANYFDQAYAADESLRRTRNADWATTIFVVNSTGKPDGRFADGRFAYAYVGGPFLVITSDAGPYGTSKLAPVVAHEFGHIFGALDQYAAAATPCAQQSGYLAVPTTNSQANNCGTRFISIMLEPLEAYPTKQIDASALGQVGYRDSDGDSLPDPLDTAPTLDLKVSQPPNGGRPVVTGTATDQPFTTLADEPATINTLARVEYRIDGGGWIALPPADAAYDDAAEQINSTLPLYDGQHMIELRALNSVGAASPLNSASVTVEGVGPAPAYAASAPAIDNTGTVTLNLTAPISSEVQISEDPFFDSANWEAAAPSMIWRFGPGDGERTLYVRFRDAGGTESPSLARTILLDRAPPTGRATFRADAPPQLYIQASDNASGVAAMQLIADDQAGQWQPYQSSLPLANTTAAATRLRVRLRDTAGNVSLPLSVATPTYLPIAGR
jgi:hypothetical protein